MRFLVSAILATLLSACVGSGQPAGGESINRFYRIDGFTWASGALVYVIVRAKDIGGKVGICGAWSVNEGSAIVSRYHEDIMEAGFITLNGERVVERLLFMPRIPWQDKTWIGQPTTCVKTDKDWEEGFEDAELDVDFPRMRIVI